MNLINELRMLAEDLHVNGYNRYSAALSKAADKLESLGRYRAAFNEWIDKTEWMQKNLPAKYLAMRRADAIKDLISELFDRLKAAEKERDDVAQQLVQSEQGRNKAVVERDVLRNRLALESQESGALHEAVERACEERDALRAELAQLHKEADKFGDGIDWIQRALQAEAKIEAMERQEPVGIQHRVPSVNSKGECVGYSMWKGGKGLDHWPHRPLYALPGAQPAPSVPREAIDKMLTQLMDIAVSNGANSVSMPDEYVEVAAWLCESPAQPAPSVPDDVIADYLVSISAHLAHRDDAKAQAEIGELLKMIAAAPKSAPSVPEGWKLVPTEPTPMMKTAGIGVEVYQDSPPSSDCLTWEEAEAIYTAMLSEAPEIKP